jgi:NitT/TauT family transport system ATP-binding protein
MTMTTYKETSRRSAIQVHNVTKEYDNGVIALEQVNLTIGQGEFVSLVGPSGCGKSTLLRIMAGLDRTTSGEVRFEDGEASREESTSFVFQEANLMPWRTVLANVALPLEVRGVPKAERKQKALQALEKVGLLTHADSFPRQLSGGMKMRVSIARALVSEPKLLFMDEPFGALDEITRHRLHRELLDIWMASNLTIVFVTHSVFEAVYLSDRVVIMEAHPGKIREIVAIDEPHPRTDAFLSSSLFGDRVRRITDELS